MMDEPMNDVTQQPTTPDPDELASLRTELEQLRGDLNSAREELSKTKQLNFTLARQLDVSRGKIPSIETQLNDLFGGGEKRG